MSESSKLIRRFIYSNIEGSPSGIVALVAQTFNISRQRAHFYISREVENGNIIKFGSTKDTKYYLLGGKFIELEFDVTKELEEDKIWTEYVKPMVQRFPQNIIEISSYGFTEIINNVRDHSDGSKIYIEVKIKKDLLDITIMDNGIGIFQKIKDALSLDSINESLLHLSKGKFTTDPNNHTGEGIFFTSRIFNKFSILSSDLFYIFEKYEWFLSPEKKEDFGQGTSVNMQLLLNSKIKPKDIMDKYTDKNLGFGKTNVAVALSADPGDPHVSRSQAKRLLMGLDKFNTIVLDFKGVESVGQSFVDEIFRIFGNEHPAIKIEFINVKPDVDEMIRRGNKKPS